jgi:hypothetical protein
MMRYFGLNLAGFLVLPFSSTVGVMYFSLEFA